MSMYQSAGFGAGRQRLRGFEALIGSSPAIVEVRRRLEQFAAVDVSVILTGETGTGKELVARLIHDNSPRSEARCVSVNCASIPEPIFESEFFGHEQGAFTGAHCRRVGYFETAHHGTLFLDEIGELPLGLQPKLFRALANREILRLGGSTAIPVDARIIAATDRDLEEMTRNAKFRSELYYRLDEGRVHIPPLRERPDDIPMLFEHFLRESFQHFGLVSPQVTDEVRKALKGFSWPGNVRQLQNLTRKILVEKPRGWLQLSHLPQDFIALLKSDNEERHRFAQVLDRNFLNVTRAARDLGCSRQQFYRKLKKLGIKYK